MTRRAKVAVVGAGGTFAMEGRHAFDWVEYGESGIVHPVGRVLAQLGELGLDIDIVDLPFRAVPSTGITPEDWCELAQLLRRVAAEHGDFSGIVVTHGTATLEETAWFLDLTCDLPAAVVVTGAQRPPNTAGSDARANLRAAVAVAADPRARELGTLVVLDNTVFAARDVTKSASFALDAFEAPGSGPLGHVLADGALVLRHRPAARERRPFALPSAASLPRVDIVLSYAGADGVAVEAFVAAGARGLISAGLLPGRPAGGEAGALKEAAAAGICVVQASRGGRGHVVSQGFLDQAGILAGGDLPPQKLRIALMLALAEGLDRAAIAERLGAL